MGGGDRGRRRRRKGGKLVWILQYLAAMPFVFLIRALPFSVAMELGRAIGVLAYKLDSRHKKVIDANLRDCLPDKTPEETAVIAVSVYENLGYSVVEFIRSSRYAVAPLDRHFRFVNYESFERAHARGRGVILLTAHCGSWELMAMAQALKGHPFGVVVRPLDNPYLDRVVTAIRTRFGNTLINKNRGMRGILNTLKEGGSVGILLDQNVTASEGVFVDYFGRKACTNKGLALIAAKTKAPVVPAFTRRVSRDFHEIVLGDEVPLVDTGDKDADLLANTQAYTRVIEDFVRMYPEQWFWMHKRWKTRPKADIDA